MSEQTIGFDDNITQFIADALRAQEQQRISALRAKRQLRRIVYLRTALATAAADAVKARRAYDATARSADDVIDGQAAIDVAAATRDAIAGLLIDARAAFDSEA